MVNQEELRKVHTKITDHFKKHADKIVVSQYTPKQHYEGRQEGERWTDSDGKLWEMKNGIPQSVSKLQAAKTPWWCPRCGLPLNTKLHEKIYFKKGFCHRCELEDDTKRRVEGTHKDYEDRALLLNKMGYYRERIIELAYYLETLHSPEFQIYDEQRGTLVMTEKWDMDLTTLRQDIGKELVDYNNALKEMEETYRERWGPLPNEERDSGDEPGQA